VLALIGSGMLAMTGTQASAASTFPARPSTNYPLAGESVRISGKVPPARRPIGLQRYSKGRWVSIAASRTRRGGNYVFAVRAYRTAFLYRTYAPKTKAKHKKYPLRYSNAVRVAAVRPSFAMSFSGAPVGQLRNGTTGTTPALAVFRPARVGAGVTIQRLVAGSWKSVSTGGRQDRQGVYRFQLNAGSAQSPARFRAVTSPARGVAAVYSAAVTPPYFSEKWRDDFAGSALNGSKWQTRTQPRFGRRLCSSPDPSMVRVGGGVATLRIARTAAPKSKACPYGVFKNAMIGTAEATPGFSGTYGFYAARMKFQSGQGQHGAFWLQGSGATGAEVDVAEYFGDGRPDGGFGNYVHYTDRNGTLHSAGGVRPVKALLGAGHTPANGWHVYSVEWSPSGYVFRLDGTPTYSTNKPIVASAKEGMILSLLSSDWELGALRSTASSVQVDWVRAWQR
jgi:hypothetical protein